MAVFIKRKSASADLSVEGGCLRVDDTLSKYLEWISGLQGSLVIATYIYEKRLEQTSSCHGKQMCFMAFM